MRSTHIILLYSCLSPFYFGTSERFVSFFDFSEESLALSVEEFIPSWSILTCTKSFSCLSGTTLTSLFCSPDVAHEGTVLLQAI